MKKSIRRFLTVMLAGVMTVSLAACGGKEDKKTEAPEWVYVPQYVELEDENGSFWSMKQVGDYLYYESRTWDENTGSSNTGIAKYSLVDGTSERVSVEIGEGSLNSFEIGEDGSIYAMVYFWNMDETTGEYNSWEELVKFDSAGKKVYGVDVAKVQQDEGIDYFGSICVDKEGRLYVSSDGKVALFNQEGKFSGIISIGGDMGGWIQSIGRGTDGKVYASSYSGTGSGQALFELDFDKKAVAAEYAGYPNSNGNSLTAGGEKDFLAFDGNSVYEYDMKTQTSEMLFKWLDSDINGQFVSNIGVMPDGRILAVMNDWNTGEYSLATLTKTPGSEVVQKEYIVIAALDENQELTSAAVNFNKSNDKYRVTINTYVDYDNWTETTYQDAITRLNNDLTSGNAPDIIDLTGLNVEQLAAKDLFADMNSYLEKSTLMSKEDYLENVLAGYTFEDVLVGIPKTFNLQTLVGNADEVGTEPGWNLEEMVAYADKYPKASLLDYASKLEIMYCCMMYNESSFVDWSSGKCNFNTPEFISLLNFVNRFPDEFDYSDETSTPTKIQNGDVLMDNAYISDFQDIQIYDEIFKGKASFIGYPTMDGSVGCALSASNAYAIIDKSSVKDAAWEFIESYLSADTEMWSWGFPSNKEQLNAKLEEAVKVETYTWIDENGVEHEEVVSGGGGMSYQDGWSYEYHTTTREEAERAMELIKLAKPAAPQNSQIMSIISEEAEAFYQGQKSAEEVADIIQRRVQTYVDENS